MRSCQSRRDPCLYTLATIAQDCRYGDKFSFDAASYRIIKLPLRSGGRRELTWSMVLLHVPFQVILYQKTPVTCFTRVLLRDNVHCVEPFRFKNKKQRYRSTIHSYCKIYKYNRTTINRATMIMKDKDRLQIILP